MNTNIRNKIVNSVKNHIGNIKDYNSLLPGGKENLTDQLIEKYSEEKGYTLSDFYNCDGNILSNLLAPLYDT